MQKQMFLEKFCPNCGAPTNVSFRNCQYCGVLLPNITARLDKIDKEQFVFRHKHSRKARESKRADRAQVIGIVYSSILLGFALFVLLSPWLT